MVVQTTLLNYAVFIMLQDRRFQVGRAGNTQRPKSVAQWSVVDVQVIEQHGKKDSWKLEVIKLSTEVVEEALWRFLPPVL